jgi:hypothetical protein
MFQRKIKIEGAAFISFRIINKDVMEEIVTKEDLRQFGLLLLDKIQTIFKERNSQQKESSDPEWLKSKAVRKLLDISAGSVQNLRMTQKIRFKKVLGSYYYNKEDLLKLFKDESN